MYGILGALDMSVHGTRWSVRYRVSMYRSLYIGHDLECNGTIALHWCTGTSHGVGVSA